MSSIKKQVEAALSVLAEARGKAPKRKTRSKSIVRLYRWSGSSTDVSWGLTSADAKKRACSHREQAARSLSDTIL